MHAMYHGKVAVLGVALWTAWAPSPARADQDASPSDQKAVVDANTQFAFDLYAQLSKGGDNLLFSPFSVSTSLGMTWAGAGGNTAKEMKKVLHGDIELAQWHAAMGALLGELEMPGGKAGCEVRVANGLWVEQTRGLLPEFLAIGQKDYRAELRAVDFAHSAEAQRKAINEWIDQRTNGKIKDIVPEKALKSDTVLVLTNTIYFKAGWEATFDPKWTKEAAFTTAGGKSVPVPMMHQTSFGFGYAEQADLQVLELPYVGKTFSMVILLPRKADGITALEKMLSAKTLAGWLRGLWWQGEREVQVELPRFSLSTADRLDQQLAELGMHDAFSVQAADFSRMSDMGEVFIGALLHSAFIAVDEKGTEAAAASHERATVKAEAPPEPAVFRADHPFIFVIRDVRSGSVLFLGRVMNPKA